MSTQSLQIKAPGIRKLSVQAIMLRVLVALIPGTITYALIIDAQVLSNLLIAIIAGFVTEALCQKLRGRPILSTLNDGSALLAIWLFVLCVPPSLPAWQLILGAFVLITFGKQIFGGLGNNPFNPAMLAYAFLLVSFPVTMTSWELPDDKVQMKNAVNSTSEFSVDGMSGATVLDKLRELKRSVRLSNHEDSSDATDWILDAPWVWLTLCWLIGGLYLLITRIITWHIPVAVLLSVSTLYLLFGFFDSGIILTASNALLTGGLIIGAFFIATDPVSAPASRHAQIIFGAGIGVFTFIIREFSVYPEGFAFAILIMNMCVPLLDRYSAGNTITKSHNGKPL